MMPRCSSMVSVRSASVLCRLPTARSYCSALLPVRSICESRSRSAAICSRVSAVLVSVLAVTPEKSGPARSLRPCLAVAFSVDRKVWKNPSGTSCSAGNRVLAVPRAVPPGDNSPCLRMTRSSRFRYSPSSPHALPMESLMSRHQRLIAGSDASLVVATWSRWSA